MFFTYVCVRKVFESAKRKMAQSTDQMSFSPDGHEHVSIFGKAKNKAKKLRDVVKENYKGHGGDDKEEEEEEEKTVEDEDQGHEKPDENVEDVTKGMAGLSGLGTANKDDRANQESGKVKKSTVGDILGKNDDGNDELRHKDSILTEEKENPKEVLSSFEESGQGRGNNGDVLLTTEKEEIGTDDGSHSIPQRMSGAIGGIIGLGKRNKQEEEGGEEKANSSKFDQPPLGLKEVPKALEEEFQSLLEKSKDAQSDDVGEGNELSSNEKPIEEMGSGTPVVTEKASGLMQGIRDSLTFGQGKKEDIVPEEQSRENQDNRMQKGEKNEGQSYAEKLFAAKSFISSKLGYGGLPTEEKASVGEDELQGPETEGVESGGCVITKKDSGLIQGMKNYLTSDQGNKDDIVMEGKQNSENQDERKESEEEEKGGQKSGIASKLGFGKLPSEEKADVEEPKGEEKADFEKSEGEDRLPVPKAEEVTENKETFKSTLVSKLSPGEDDKALSEKITEVFNNSAKSILGGFYGGSTKEEGPPSPSPATPDLPQNNNPQNASSPKGIMGRVTGVVSSFIGKKPKEDVADNSPPTQVSSAEPIFGEHKEDPIVSSETQTRNQIEGGTK